MLYPINEIFYSIQGEGFHIGSPAIFIRLAGCNLKCPWCDTDHSKKMEMTEDEIVTPINHYHKIPLIVVTGGEPTIHNLEYLLKELKKQMSAMIAIETNGTNPQTLGGLKELGLIDWVTISPKKETKFSSLKYADEIKVVFDGKINPIDYACPESHLFIQPCSEDFRPAVDYVMKNPEWRLSIQIQKIIRVR